jgi:hypothetical protein
MIINRYLDILDTLYDAIIDDMNKEGFTVGDKYKTKYDELGKIFSAIFLIIIISLFHLLSYHFHIFTNPLL